MAFRSSWISQCIIWVCISLCETNRLQIDQFWAVSLAWCSPISKQVIFLIIVFSQAEQAQYMFILFLKLFILDNLVGMASWILEGLIDWCLEWDFSGPCHTGRYVAIDNVGRHCWRTRRTQSQHQPSVLMAWLSANKPYGQQAIQYFWLMSADNVGRVSSPLKQPDIVGWSTKCQNDDRHCWPPVMGHVVQP